MSAAKRLQTKVPLASHLHFAAGAGNPDLFRARLAGGFHRALHDVAHLG